MVSALSRSRTAAFKLVKLGCSVRQFARLTYTFGSPGYWATFAFSSPISHAAPAGPQKDADSAVNKVTRFSPAPSTRHSASEVSGRMFMTASSRLVWILGAPISGRNRSAADLGQERQMVRRG